MIGYLDKVIRPLDLILPKISGYVKTFKVKDKNNKLIPFHTNDEKLLEKYKAIWTKIEGIKKYWVKCFTSLWYNWCKRRNWSY